MIPAPPGVALPPDVAADAPLLRAAEVVMALRAYGRVLITAECLTLWPTLGRLDLRVLSRDAGGTIRNWHDPATAGTMLQVER